MKYRTIGKALKELQKIDPETSISEFVIRKLAKEQKISQVKSGNKTMVDVDSLIAFLNGENTTCTLIELEN